MAVFGEFEDTCLLQCGSFKADRDKPLSPGTCSAQDRAGLCPSDGLPLLSGDQFLTALGHFDKVWLLFTLRVSHNLKNKQKQTNKQTKKNTSKVFNPSRRSNHKMPPP